MAHRTGTISHVRFLLLLLVAFSIAACQTVRSGDPAFGSPNTVVDRYVSPEEEAAAGKQYSSTDELETDAPPRHNAPEKR